MRKMQRDYLIQQVTGLQRNDGYTIDDVPELWRDEVRSLLDAVVNAA